MTNERFDLRRAHLLRMTFVVKEDEKPNPGQPGTKRLVSQ